MNQHLETILNFIQRSKGLSDDAKSDLIKDVQKADGEMENKNHELEIEIALDRVRAVAMDMNTPDDLLNICKALFKELQHLQFGEVRNAIIHTYPDGKNYFIDYDYSDFNKGQISKIPHSGNPIIEKFVQDIRISKDAFTEISITGNDLKQWQSFRDANNEIADERLSKTSALYYYLYSIGNASIGISTFDSVPVGKQEVLKRFRNVFDLAYKRYVDITNAEAQTREAKIEASLERMRAVAMSMDKPDDLLNICETMYREFNSFGFTEMRNAMINIHNDENKTFVNYDYSDTIGRSINHLHYDIHPVIEKQVMQMRSATDAFSETVFEGKDLADWKKFREEVGEKDDPRINAATALYYYFYSIATGSIGISSFTPVKEKKLEVLKRFRNVFDLSYKRYTDISLAEAQAREAQIELALERVRARTMAMQYSDELKDAAALLFQQVKSLGAPAYSCGYNIWEKDEKEFTSWMSTQDGSIINGVPNIPLTEDANFIRYVESKEKGEPFFVLELRGKRMQEHYKYLKTIPAFKAYFDYAESVGFDLPETQIHHIVNFSKGNLLFITLEPCPEYHDVFKRFASVFEQTYTRFLDLQKAEAQARESQIELALERVRARSLAMHHTLELQEVVNVAAQQLLNINIDINGGVFIIINNEVAEDIPFWASSGAAEYIQKVVLPFRDIPIISRLRDAIRSGNNFFVEEYSREEKTEFFEHLFRYSPWNLVPPKRKKELLGREGGLTRSVIIAQHTSMGITNHFGKKFSDIDNAVLKRFSNVLEQSYTRFLDLQKAEAQAREAQIQLALERVRARTMAMQKSNELQDAAILLFQQMKALGVQTGSCGFNIWNDDEKAATVWMSSAEGGLQAPFKMPHTESGIYKNVYAAMKNGEDLLVKDVGGKALEKHFDYLLTLPGIEDTINRLRETGYAFPKNMVYHFAFFKNGYLSFHTHEPYPEAHDIFKRFAKVFEQTYTRFLDLQKAEAQARQAKIEAAMEKVRSKAMAMQKPDELVEVAELLRKEMGLLGVEELETSSIYIHHNETQKTECWYAIKEVNHPEKELVSDHMNIDLNDTWVGRQMLTFYHSDKKQISIPMQGDARKEWINYCADHSKGLVGFYGDNIPDRTYHLYKFSNGYMGAASPGDISTESWDLLQRATSVFSLAYTRFSDLQQAEAQAREARIEAALERVRSRTMGMQKSEELKEVIQVVYDQFVHLNIHVEHTGFIIDYKEREDMYIWLADKHAIPFQVAIPYFDCAHWNSFNKAKEKGIDFFVNQLSFEEKNKFYQDLFKLIPGVPEETLEYYFSCPGLAISTVLLENVGLYIENFSAIPYSDEENRTLMRFGKVFQQTYTRFLDLQKAEAYAEKAQIEEQKLREEKKRSDSLLLNILPEEIANELKQYGKSYARKHEEVTILFSDIKGFSIISEDLSADELVTQLDECFRAFDKIVEKHGLEKIKTVGDAYICACGLPTPVTDNAIKTVRAAIDMLDFLKGFNSSKKVQDLPAFEFRIGIHTGPVVTGVVGLKKFTYDIWGDAVNMAARMEQHGEAGRINVSENTYQLIKDKFTCTPRGKILAKNKGEVDMYFVDCI